MMTEQKNKQFRTCSILHLFDNPLVSQSPIITLPDNELARDTILLNTFRTVQELGAQVQTQREQRRRWG